MFSANVVEFFAVPRSTRGCGIVVDVGETSGANTSV